MQMTLEISLTVFFFSLFLGSFYNVLALRTLNKESISYPPSHCTVCNHRLAPVDLVPVFSYLMLGGKCRYCKSKISHIYPLGEILTAISYIIIINKYGFTLETLIQLVFITIMILSTITDMKETIVPDGFIVTGLIVVLVLRLINKENLLYYVVSSIISFLLLFLILILSGGKMGGADVKLYALIGLVIGLNDSIISLFYASIIALILNIKKLIKKEKNTEIPFVPYITLGVLGTYIFSTQILMTI